MKKLNQKKIRWIIREMNKEERYVYKIAKTMDVTPRWARGLYQTYQKTKQFPFPQKPGRKPRLVSIEERNLILEIRREYPLSGAIALEKILDSKGVHIGHNRIHRILKEDGLAQDESRKQRRRKWIRYEPL